jgi:hypothetical protein
VALELLLSRRLATTRKEEIVRVNKSIWYFSLVLGLFALAIPAGLRADTLYNNIASPTGGDDHVNGFGPLADSFAVGASNFSFGSLTVLLDGAGSSEKITAAILSNASGHPGTVLETIGSISQVFASGSADYTFALATPYTLLAGDTYWLQLTGSNGDTVGWDWSADQTAQGVAGQSFANSRGVFSNIQGPYQMKITSAAVVTPEPNMLLVLGMAIGALALFLRK